MKIVLILLDAFRHDYILKDNTPFLYNLMKKSDYIKQVVPSYGFCERTEILSGLNSKESGFFTAIGYDPNGSEYKNMRFLKQAGFIENLLSDALFYKKHSFRSIFRRIVIKYLIRRNKFKMRTYEIPLSLLHYFNLTEDLNDHRDKNAFKSESIFDLLEKNGKKCFYDSFTALGLPENGGDNDKLQLVLNQASHKDFQLYLIYNSKPDFLGHKYGVKSIEMKNGLNLLDKSLSDFTEKFIKKEPKTTFIYLGDHGMTNVLDHFNAQNEMLNLAKSHNLKLHTDYIYFLDSTIARIWFISKKAKVLKDMMCNSKLFLMKGNFVDNIFAEKYNIPLGDSRYGDLIWVANEGVLITPDFFHTIHDVPIGMHGYNPNLPNSRGCSIVFDNAHKQKKIKIFEEKKLTYIFEILKKAIKN